MLPLLGFFQSKYLYDKEKSHPPLFFVSTSEEGNSIWRYKFMTKVSHLGKSLNQSSRSYKVGFCIGGGFSGGLILCGFNSVTYLVCNPYTNQWLSLPKPRTKRNGYCVIGFSSEGCDDDGLIHFNVIRVGSKSESINTVKMLRIEMFSSRTREWKESMLTCPSKVFMSGLGTQHSLCYSVVGRVFYWPAMTVNCTFNCLAAYDPTMAQNHLWLISCALGYF